MRVDDLPAVAALADRIHVNYPESPEVLAEKLALFPKGCFVLADGQADVRGYCISHPWMGLIPPALDRLMHRLPEPPTLYFIHDIALDERERGKALAQSILTQLIAICQSRSLRQLILIAVSGSVGFWQRQGFLATQDGSLQASVREKYGLEAVHMTRPIPTSP